MFLFVLLFRIRCEQRSDCPSCPAITRTSIDLYVARNDEVNIKKPYFDRNSEQPESVGGGVEAMHGIYQSIRMADGKRMVVNIDVSHTFFWNKPSFPMIINGSGYSPT